MRIPWLPIALGVSVLANLGLIALVLVMALDAGHYEADQASSWRGMAAERRELRAMRTQNQAPDRPAVLAWAVSMRSPEDRSEPFERMGCFGWTSSV